jgi:hypothetical protein
MMIEKSQERATVKAMIRLYCRQQHNSRKLCEDCTRLWEYAEERLEKCPFGVENPTCQNCPIHCYKPEMRQHIREVMRYSGPRMMLHHPLMAIRHLIQNKKTAP